MQFIGEIQMPNKYAQLYWESGRLTQIKMRYF